VGQPVVGGLLLPVLAGCLAEQSLTLPASQSRRVQPSADVPAAPPSTRAWLRAAHAQLIDLLPPDDPPVLLTEDLATAENRPRDVFAHFDLDPDALHTVIGNYSGLRCTAQGASQDMTVDAPPPPWSGFDDVWIEMADGVRLAARLGFAKDGDRRRDADCIVILPGFFGDNGVVRTRDLARFLLDSGFHVLALEMRGHGQTERTHVVKGCGTGIPAGRSVVAPPRRPTGKSVPHGIGILPRAVSWLSPCTRTSSRGR
jgi:hypothetical protein